MGHDGLVLVDAEMDTTFYVAFEARQAKSALGNSGLFLAHSNSLSDPMGPGLNLSWVQAHEAKAWLAGQAQRDATQTVSGAPSGRVHMRA